MIIIDIIESRQERLTALSCVSYRGEFGFELINDCIGCIGCYDFTCDVLTILTMHIVTVSTIVHRSRWRSS